MPHGVKEIELPVRKVIEEEVVEARKSNNTGATI
jgi:hypothetical protein